jgi:histone H3/H4
VAEALEDSTDEVERPVQHKPWVPHICAAYSDDFSLLGDLSSRLGPVAFDRVRVSFGEEDTDIPLNGSLTAAVSGPFRRELTSGELTSTCDFARMNRAWERAVDAALVDLRPVRTAQIESVRSQILSSARDGDIDDLSGVSVDDEDMFQVLLEHMIPLARAAGKAQQREAENQGVSVPRWDLSGTDTLTAAAGLDLLRQIARVTARLSGASLIQSAVRRALSLVGRPSVTPVSVAEDVSEHLTDLSESSLRDLVGGAVTSAQNEGRRTVLAVAPPASFYESSEILDRNICKPCRDEDGTRYEKLGDANKAYPSGGFRDCLGGVRCRGTVVAVWNEEE